MKPTSDCQTTHYHVDALIDMRYRLIDFVGAGGMACVYKAREEGTPHTYAIKFLRNAYHNEDYLVDFFRDEASSMRDLAHPNIVRFYRFVHTDAYSYIVMDYVEGFSLSDVIKRMYKLKTEIPLDEVVRIMTQVARALDTIHREDYVHRDVKPSNVLIERQTGQTYLTDLGITTASNMRIEGAGTVAYMPPETAETGVADHRADIYSYGIMFYEMLAKQRPFNPEPGLRGQAAEDDLAQKHRRASVPPLTRIRPDLPDALNEIMERALAKAPNQRYESIMQLAQDIHTALKPQLGADLQDFANITARRIEAPDAQTTSAAPLQRTNLLYGAIAILVAVAATAALLLGTDLFSAPANATTRVASTTVMPATLTPNPLSGQPRYPLVSGSEALVRAPGTTPLEITANQETTLHFLRIGAVNGFSTTLSITAVDAGIERYGIAFRVQDADNYLLFTLEPETRNWTFAEVLDAEQTTLRSGTFDTLPQMLQLGGIDDYFELNTSTTTLILQSERFEVGSVALWLDGTAASTIQINDLALRLVGPDATAATSASPTPVPIVVDEPLLLFQVAVENLLAANNPSELAINCPDYIVAYNALQDFVDSDDTAISQLARDTRDAGEVVFSICRIESPNSEYTFRSGIQDYNRWEDDLNAILLEIEARSS